MADKTQRISDKTRASEQRDAKAEHGAPEVPSAEEDAAAPTEADPAAAKAYGEYLDRAKDAKGEGRIP
jgi:hypothetical protein